jgi:hypothetical protein
MVNLEIGFRRILIRSHLFVVSLAHAPETSLTIDDVAFVVDSGRK